MRGACGLPTASLVLLLLPAPQILPARAEVYLSPGLELRGGYTSNRFLEPAREGSVYSFVAPSLGATWFAPREVELNLSVRHERTEYLRSGFSSLRQTAAQASLSRLFGAYAAVLGAELGTYDDGALPLDDSDWFRLSPVVSRDLSAWLTGSLSASFTGTRYETRETSDGEKQTEVHWQVKPGLAWAVSTAWNLWGSATLDLNRSNQDSEDYWGAGLTVGVDYWSRSSSRFGGWASWSVLEYAEDDPAEGGGRRDTPLGVGGWVAFRVAPWAEITASTRYLRYRSTEDASDYSLWNVEAGLRVVYDWDAAPFTSRM